MPVISDVRHILLRYDADTLSFIPWDGSLEAGSLVIGAVTQSGTWVVTQGGTWTTRAAQGGTGTLTQVADTTSEGVLLAANANRVLAIVANDASAVLYVGLGASTVSSSAWSYRLEPGDSCEVTAYTGVIRGVWASDPNDGGAKVTEVTI